MKLASNIFTLSRNKIERTSQLEAVDMCLWYILDSERDDFAENPSASHIYFEAYLACFGLRLAKELLAYELSKGDICQKSTNID